MSAPIDHKKPTAAFVLLFVIVSAILGNGLRARADGTSLVFAFPTTIEADATPPVADAPGRPADAGAPAGTPTGTGAAPSTTAVRSPRHETSHTSVHGHRHVRPAARSRARGPLGHEGTAVRGVPGAQDVPRVAVQPGGRSVGSIHAGFRRPSTRAAGVRARVSLQHGGVKVRVGVGRFRAHVRLSLRGLAGAR